jgi:hypothetical protein
VAFTSPGGIIVPRDFLPSSNADLLAWSTTFAAYITANAAAVGLLPAQSTQYQAYHDDFDAKLAVSANPATRTRGTIEATGASRTTLKAYARELARIVNAFPATTNQQRLDMGLNPRAGEATPINPPTEPPALEVLGAIGRILKLRLHAINSAGRGKPDGVAGASVFSFVGAAPPPDITEWVFQGSTTRTSFDVEFAPTVPAGAQVWLCAFWYSPRAQPGPASQPISAYLAGGVVAAEAA